MASNAKLNFNPSKNYAESLDKVDPLNEYRNHFVYPKGKIYLDGNSLGLMPKAAEEGIQRVLTEWKTLGIEGWLEGKIPWFYYAEHLGKLCAPFVGAKPEEVIATGTTTVNLHSLVSTFYQPTEQKYKILADELNFPSDIYALRSQIELRGFDPQQGLVLAPSTDGNLLDEDQIISLMTEEIALILLPSVLYRSGQLLDIDKLTKAAHARHIPIGFDCSHSVGAVPHFFDAWNVDFAFWCSYKYLNGGPGASAFLYVNERHFSKTVGLRGWFGNNKKTQFDLALTFDQAKSAGAWQISSPNTLSAASIESGLNIITEAGIENIREKSLQLTQYFMNLVSHYLHNPPYSFSILNPIEEKRRGGHIALSRNAEVYRISQALKAHGIIPDFRPPNIIRIAPIALYNTYSELYHVVQTLKNIIDDKEFENFSDERKEIS